MRHLMGSILVACILLCMSAEASPTCLNIDDYGCVPFDIDPDFDNGPIINSMIAGLGKEAYLPIFIPGRGYGLKTTLLIPNTCIAFRMSGTGRSQFVPTSVGGLPVEYQSMQSRFIWTGEPGGTMMRIETAGSCMDGIALCGGAEVSTTRAGTGLLIAKGAGIGTGKLWIPQITVANCDTGIRFGGAGATDVGNCDQSRIQQLVIDSCRIGVHNYDSQALNNCIGQAWIRNTDTAFYVEGGRFSVDATDVLSSVKTFVRIGNRDGALLFRFSNVQVDAPAASTIILDATECQRPAVILFDSFFYGPVSTQPVFLLRDHVQLTIRDANWMRSGMASCTGVPGRRTTAIRLDGCKFHVNQTPQSFVDVASSRAPWHCSWTGCHEYYGKPFEDGHVGEE